MVPVPARCAGCSWKNVGWVGWVWTLFKLLDTWGGGRRVKSRRLELLWDPGRCGEPKTTGFYPPLPRGNLGPTLFDVNFSKSTENPAYILYKKLLIFTGCQLTETFWTTPPAKHNTSVGQGPLQTRAWLLQVWSLDQQPPHLLGAG